MRIEYEITEDEFIEASLAAALPRSVSDARRLARRRTIAWAYWLALIVVWLWLIGQTGFGGTWRRLSSITRDEWCVAIGRYEWLLPWLLFWIASMAVVRSFRRGRRAVRLAATPVAALFVVMGGAVVAAELLTDRHLLLEPFGLSRIIPWAVAGGTVLRLFLHGWSNRALRKHFARSDYADGPATLEIDESGVRDVLTSVTHEWRWSAFDDARQTGRLLVLTNRNGQPVTLIPKRAIGTSEEVVALAAILKSRVGSAAKGFAVDLPTGPSAITPG